MANAVYSPTRRVRFVLRLVMVLIAICGVAAGGSAQTTVTLSTPGTHINADLTIQGGASGMVDFSGSDVLASKVGSESYTRRIMMKFDTENFIPAKAVIQSAQLYLVLKGAQSGESRPLTAYHVSESFVKGETNWCYFRSGQAWSTAGGDWVPASARHTWATPGIGLYVRSHPDGAACGERRIRIAVHAGRADRHRWKQRRQLQGVPLDSGATTPRCALASSSPTATAAPAPPRPAPQSRRFA